jgi:cation diffusion facilitator family transporter
VNAVAVLVVAVLIFIEAVRRLGDTPEIEGGLLLAMALAGGGVNLLVAWVLHEESRISLNVRSAFLHVLGDLLGSVGVLIAAVAVVAAGWLWVDPLVSILIGLIILVGAVQILREATAIFLEASPPHIDVDELVEQMGAIPGVKGIHDLHVWSITPAIHALSCHLLLENQTISQACGLLEVVNSLLSDRFSIAHSTIRLRPTVRSQRAPRLIALNGESETHIHYVSRRSAFIPSYGRRRPPWRRVERESIDLRRCRNFFAPPPNGRGFSACNRRPKAVSFRPVVVMLRKEGDWCGNTTCCRRRILTSGSHTLDKSASL